MSPTPNFTGMTAAILHRPDPSLDVLTRRLHVIGLRTLAQWAPLAPPFPGVVFVDADNAWSGLLPWAAGEAPAPVIALLGSEAPGRIAWALDNGARALIAKPVAASAVYPALVMAARAHAEARIQAQRLASLEERIRLRPLVLGAVQALMARENLDEAAAYAWLQREAMRLRRPLEQAAAEVLAAPRAAGGRR